MPAYTVDSSGAPTAVTSTSPLPVQSGAPAAADIVNGFQTFAVTTGARGASMPLTIIAPVGNAVTVTVATTQAGTASVVDAFASGRYV